MVKINKKDLLYCIYIYIIIFASKDKLLFFMAVLINNQKNCEKAGKREKQMNLKGNKNLTFNKLYVIITMVLLLGALGVNMGVQAASKNTTKVSVWAVDGNKNPLKHDTGYLKVTYCTRHPKTKVDPMASKVNVTLFVKSSHPKTKEVKKKYNSVGVNRTDLAHCDWNEGSKTISAKTNEDDNYTAKAAYNSTDCFCLECFLREFSDAEKYCEVTSKTWVKE